MDVVVDDVIAVLEVLPLGNAIGADEEINLAFLLRQDGSFVFRPGRKEGEQRLEIVGFRECAFLPIAAGDFRGMQLLRFQKMLRQMLVEVVRRVCERGEHEHLSVPGIDGRREFAEDRGFEVLELGVVGRCDLPHLGEQPFDDGKIAPEFLLPTREIHVGKADLHLVANRFFLVIRVGKLGFVIGLRVLKRRRQVGESGVSAGLLERGNLRQRAGVIVREELQRQPE